MDTSLMIGFGLLFGALAAVAARDVLRAMATNARMQPVPVRVRARRRCAPRRPLSARRPTPRHHRRPLAAGFCTLSRA
ncbi:hypothetical protein [Burkholderia multivorans]|uniref:hypothetical protein n=1 Tax=Burkholderia multivorans TaxID=87883 RepID=UPI0021BF49F6|nr:hypothetical protein [Burkholderia multivorans]